jgi:signal transduction histidine kinase
MNRLTGAQLARQTWTYVDLAMVALAAAAVIVFFYSGTFLNWEGVKGLYQTFDAWFKTGSNGNGHEKDWYYWFMLIGTYEQPVALGLIVCLFALFIKNLSLRYLAIYGVGVLIAYSIVRYKTPWCIISIIWPFLFLFGALLVIVPVGYRRIAYLGAAVLLAASLGLSIRLNYFRCTTDTEPYVYVQTYNDVWKLTKPLLRLAHRNPTYYHMVGHLIRTSTYPLPWMLGDFTRIGYYEHDNLPDKLDADFLVVQEDKIAEVESKLHDSYYTEPMRIRASQDSSKLYLSAKVFSNFYPGRVPDFTGKAAKP